MERKRVDEWGVRSGNGGGSGWECEIGVWGKVKSGEILLIYL